MEKNARALDRGKIDLADLECASLKYHFYKLPLRKSITTGQIAIVGREREISSKYGFLVTVSS